MNRSQVIGTAPSIGSKEPAVKNLDYRTQASDNDLEGEKTEGVLMNRILSVIVVIVGCGAFWFLATNETAESTLPNSDIPDIEAENQIQPRRASEAATIPAKKSETSLLKPTNSGSSGLNSDSSEATLGGEVVVVEENGDQLKKANGTLFVEITKQGEKTFASAKVDLSKICRLVDQNDRSQAVR